MMRTKLLVSFIFTVGILVPHFGDGALDKFFKALLIKTNNRLAIDDDYRSRHQA